MKAIDGVCDPLWDFWLSVYYQSFPENQRMTVQYLMARLTEEPRNAPPAFLGVSEWKGKSAGIAFYQPRPEHRLVELWYLAVAPALRGTGAGTALFAEVVAAAKSLNVDLLVWEVELPDQSDPTPERRIGWYQKMGGKKIEGIRYHIKVDESSPPLPMGLMVAFLTEQEWSAEAVYHRLKANYKDTLEQDGILRLV